MSTILKADGSILNKNAYVIFSETVLQRYTCK